MHPNLDSLPDDVLVQIGKSVIECYGVVDFVQLAQTSKGIHDTLMDDDIVSSILEEENKRIFKTVFSSNSTLTVARTLEEMALCQRLAHAKRTGVLNNGSICIKRATEDQLKFLHNHKNFMTDKFIPFLQILGRHPSALAILNLHIPTEDPIVSIIYRGKCRKIQTQLRESSTDRIFVRLWRGSSMMGIEFTIRLGQVEVPPLPPKTNNLFPISAFKNPNLLTPIVDETF